MSEYYYDLEKDYITDGKFNFHWKVKGKDYYLPTLNGPIKYNRNDILDLVNRQSKQIEDLTNLLDDLLWQIGDMGNNNKPCKNCISHAEELEYCTMYDMEVKSNEIVIRCENGEWKKED